MAITKVTSGLISADAASVDLNIDAGTLYVDSTNNRVGIANTSPSVALDVTGAITSSGDIRANGGDYYTNSGAAGNYRGFGDRVGLSIVNGATYLYDAASTSVIALAAYAGNVHIYNELKMGNLSGTTVIDSSRNLVNIGTISSGSHTSTGDVGFAVNSGGNAYMVIDRSASDRRGALVFSTAATDVTASPPANATLDWALGVTDSDEISGDKFYIHTDTNASNARFVIDGSNGNVGIGTTSPDNQSKLTLDLPSATNGRILSMYRAAGAYGYHLGIDSSSRFTLYNNNGTSALMVVDSSGNVGIGTDDPDRRLHVKGSNLGAINIESTSTSDAFIEFTTANNNAFIGIDESLSVLKINGTGTLGGAVHLAVDTSGNVGIGTSSPNANLEVANGSDAATLILNAHATSQGATSRIQSIREDFTGSTSEMAFSTNDGTSLVERMRIDTDGRVGIGTNDPGSRLHLYANDPQILLDDSGTQSSITGQSGNILYKTSSTNRDHVFFGVSAEVARITGDANFSITGGNWSGADRFNLSVDQFDAGATFQTGEFLLFGDHDGSRDKMLALKRAGSDVVVVDSGGALVLGDSSATSKLTVIDEGEVNGEVAWFKGGANYGAVNVFARGTSYTWAHGIGGGSSTNANIPASYYGIEERAATNRPVRLAISHTHGEVSINASYSGSTFPFRVGYSTDGTLDNYTPTFTIDDSANVRILAVGNDQTRQLRIDGTNGSGQTFGFITEADGENGRVSFKVGQGGATPTQELMIHPDGGITFGTDTAAANALDDYEEGTWSTTFSGTSGATATWSSGFYTKIGNMVFANFAFSVNSQVNGNNYVVLYSGPFVMHQNNITWTGYCTNYSQGDRRSGIIINNSSSNNTQWFVGWKSNSTVAGTIRGVIVYQTTS